MMTNKEQADKFINYANKRFISNKKKWSKYLSERKMTFDEDVYSETIIKVYDYILKNGIKDDSEEGLANYWFKSFNMNIKRERLYSRNLYKDSNVDASSVLDRNENGDQDLQDKLRRETYNEFFQIYVLKLIEQNFDARTFYVFRLYYILDRMTYKKLREITKIPSCKQLVVEAKKWLIENLNEEEIKKSFNKWYDE